MTKEVKQNIDSQFEITQSKLLQWRNRYTKQEYPGKVALNLHYLRAKGMEYFPFVAASYGIDHTLANGQDTYMYLKQMFVANVNHHAIFTDVAFFGIAYNVVRSYEKQAEANVIPTLEAKIQKWVSQSNPLAFGINQNVLKANAGDVAALRNLERSYTVEAILFETFLHWAACGLMNKEPMEGMALTIPVVPPSSSTFATYDAVSNYLYTNFVMGYVNDHLVALPPL